MYFLDKSQHLLLVIRYWLKTYFFQKLSTRYHSKPARSSSKTYPLQVTCFCLQNHSLLVANLLVTFCNLFISPCKPALRLDYLVSSGGVVGLTSHPQN